MKCKINGKSGTLINAPGIRAHNTRLQVHAKFTPGATVNSSRCQASTLAGWRSSPSPRPTTRPQCTSHPFPNLSLKITMTPYNALAASKLPAPRPPNLVTEYSPEERARRRAAGVPMPPMPVRSERIDIGIYNDLLEACQRIARDFAEGGFDGVTIGAIEDAVAAAANAEASLEVSSR